MTTEPDFVDDFADPSPTEDTGLAPAAEGSVLASLRSRREDAKSKLHLDLEVPRLDPPVFVRFKPTTQARISAANKHAAKTADKDAEIVANAGILADACVGIFEVIDGKPVSIDEDRSENPEDWPRFERRLANLLGVRAGKASDAVRGLYLTDGDIISTVTQLGVWSGFATAQIERDPEGN